MGPLLVRGRRRVVAATGKQLTVTDWSDAALLGQDSSQIAPPEVAVPWDLILLDRDGTLNVHRPGYISSVSQLRLRRGAADFVAKLTSAGLRTALVTNQRGLATGLLSPSQLIEVHQTLIDRLARKGGELNAIEVCGHQAGTCDCRKPLPGMIFRLLSRAPWANPARVVMVGDQESDRLAAVAAGVNWLDVGRSGTALADAAEILTGNVPPKRNSVMLVSARGNSHL